MTIIDMKETYFPRGGNKTVPKKTGDVKKLGTPEKKAMKRKGGGGSSGLKKSKTEDSDWIYKVENNMFTEGLMGIGVVSEVFDGGVILETAASRNVKIDVSEMPKKLVELINEDKVEMEELFKIGQMIAFKVLAKSNSTKNVSINATCNPSKLNKHLSPKMIVSGLVLSAAVISIEEKGAVLDIGMDQITGFVEKSQFPAAGLIEGEVLLTRVLSSTSRVVKVSCLAEQDNLNMMTCETLQLNNLMPGTILECEPTGDEPIACGVYVSIGNGLKGILPRQNLPPRLRENPERLGKSIRAVVAFCQQNSKVLVLHSHPDIVSLSRVDKRINFEGINIGDKLSLTVIDKIENKFVIYSLPPVDGRASLITGISSIGYLEHREDIGNKYTLGDVVNCRVVSLNHFSRSVVVSDRKDIMEQQIVSYKDAVCGEIMEGTVTFVSKKGVNFKLCNFINAFAPISLLFDKPYSGNLRAKFPSGSTVKCRVWEVCNERKKLIVICRESIINMKSAKANSVEQLAVGNRVPCIVKKIFDSGVLLLRTYNNMAGVLLKRDAATLKNIKINDFIGANVEKIENDRIRFTLGLEKNEVDSDKTIVKKAKLANNIELGKVFSGEMSASKDEKTIVKFTSKDTITAEVDDSMISDLLESPTGLIRRYLCSNPRKVETIVPMGSIGGINRACVNRFVANWVSKNTIPTGFNDLEEDMLVCGVVTQIVTDVGVYVEIAGGSGLTGRVLDRRTAKKTVEMFEVGQTVIGKVLDLKKERKQFSLDPLAGMGDGKLMIDEYTIPMLKNIAEEVAMIAEMSGYPLPGTIVKGKIVTKLDDMNIVEFVHNGKKLSGIVRKKKEKEDEKAKQFVVVDINPLTNEIVLAVKKGLARILAIRRDYICAVDDNGLIMLPTRLHPNQLPNESTLNIHDEIEFDNVQKHGHVRVACRSSGIDNDVSRASLVKNEFSVNKTTKEGIEAKEHEEKNEQKESKSLKAKSVKVFGVYNGIVKGISSLEKQQKKCGLFVNIDLPGSNHGRLHVSELPGSILQNYENPLRHFVERNKNKSVIVRVIGVEKIRKENVYELTMNRAKIQESKAKGKDLAYSSKFKVGDIVQCFGANSNETELRVEVNGLWRGRIPRENLSDDMLVKSTAGENLVDLVLDEGEAREALVTGVNVKNKLLDLSLQTNKKTENLEFVIGETVTGRVFSTGPTLNLKLSNGKQAMMGATAISSMYESFEQIVSEKYQIGQIVKVICAATTDKPKRFYVTAVNRYLEQNATKRRLIVKKEQLKKNEEIDGVVVSTGKKSCIELGCGVYGLIDKKVNIGSVVSVIVQDVENLKISLKKIISLKKNLKRKLPTETEIKPEVSLKQAPFEEFEVEDPGFDWSGFKNEEFAEVGKLRDDGKQDEQKQVTVPESVDDEEDEGVDDEDDDGVDDEEDEGVDNEEDEGVDNEEIHEEEEKEVDENNREDDLIDEEELTKQLRGDPNSAILWIKYMSLFLSKSDLKTARTTAERALEAINYREAAELKNMWTAYLNLEVSFGDAMSVQKVFERACNNVDSYTMHHQLAQIYQNSKKNEEAKQILEAMIKKFRSKHVEVWTLLAEHLMKNGDVKGARDLLKRALASATKDKHTMLISKFAQLEYKYGDAERGTTLFEGLVTAHPKKTDLWLVYVDAALKHIGIEQARNIMEKACNNGASLHKVRPLYKKWVEIEGKYGDEKSIELVKVKAEKYLQSVAENALKED